MNRLIQFPLVSLFIILAAIAVQSPSACQAQAAAPQTVVQLTAFLKALDQKAAARTTAKTSAQKAEFKSQLGQFAVAALEKGNMTLTTVITDVRVPKDGVAEIHYQIPELTNSTCKSLQNIRFHYPGQATVNLSKDKALLINPGTTMRISGHAVFTPSKDVVSDAFASVKSILTITVKDMTGHLGVLDISDRKYDITGL